MSKRIFSALMLILISSCLLRAAEGCLYTTGTLYVDRNGTRNGLPRFDYDTSDPSGYVLNAASVYCIRVTTPGNSCWIRIVGGGSNAGDFGTYVDYGPLPCPIDDYIPLTILLIGGLSFFYIRNKHINICN